VTDNENENPMGQSQAHKLILIRSELLQPGMYVAELDRSWLHSPFPSSGFLIDSASQLAEVRSLCRYVYVDAVLSEVPLPVATLAPRPAHSAHALGQARQVLAESLLAIAGIVRGARRQGSIDLGATAQCASRLVDQVMEAPDPLHWCLRTDAQGSLLYRRAVGTAALAVTLGRRLGFDRPALKSLATGGLLLDIGKIAVPVPILAKPGALDGAEEPYVRRHVERGLELVAGRDAPPRAVEMLAAHHERMDGSGYPHGLRGTQIPLFGRIAAIADVFDALMLNRRYAAAMSPHAALRQLDSLRDVRFDGALVSELTHAIGLYPVGTPVELADGGVAFVCGQRVRAPLQPQVIVTHDASRTPLDQSYVVAAAGRREIVRTLPAHVVNLDANRVEAALHAFRDSAA
jgi:HD-GYP domain-containing protein (c-di-GMP phosphodiesterase class II)